MIGIPEIVSQLYFLPSKMSSAYLASITVAIKTRSRQEDANQWPKM